MRKLMRIAEDAGISVEYCKLPLNESITVQDDDGDVVLMDTSLAGEGANERVHLAHEIGHSMTGAFYNPYTPLDIRAKHEYRANKWAVKQLISGEELHEAMAEGYTEIWSLAEYFNVTEDFMKMVVCWYTYGNLSAELYF